MGHSEPGSAGDHEGIVLVQGHPPGGQVDDEAEALVPHASVGEGVSLDGGLGAATGQGGAQDGHETAEEDHHENDPSAEEEEGPRATGHPDSRGPVRRPHHRRDGRR